jgi:predicted dehydrogenase
LPIANQRDFIRAALVAGKHVLSEKPVAENLKEAAELIAWYRENHSINASWHVAENWRFLASVAAAKGEVSKLGRVLGFNVRISDNIQKGWKFFGKNPLQSISLTIRGRLITTVQRPNGARFQLTKEGFCLMVASTTLQD